MTKMKYHKIRNIELKTCTVEQVAAYNLCWQYITDLMTKRYFKLEWEFQKDNARYEIRQFIFNNLKQSYDFEKFKKRCNLDALQNCLDNGLDAYLNLKKDGKPSKTILNYDEVSKIFKSELVKKYEEKARKIVDNYELSCEQKKKKINRLLEKFIEEVKGA